MKKIISFILSILLLFSCVPQVTVLADSQSTMVKYSVLATVIYKDYDGTSTTQKVKVGTILKAPEAKGKPGCRFIGWKDAKTGDFWDFSKPVTEHMTLVACYSPKNNSNKPGQGNTNNTPRKLSTSAKTITLPKTGDISWLEGYEITLMLSIAVMAILLYMRKKEEE